MSGGSAKGERPRRRRVGRIVGWSVLTVAVLLVVAAVLLVRDALEARSSFAAVVRDLPAAQDALIAGDLDAYDRLVTDLQSETATARASTDGPLWWLAARVPGIGPNAAALTLVGEVVDDVAVDVLPHLGAASGVLADGGLRLTDGRIDLDPIRAAALPLATARDTVVDADDRLQAFDATGLVDEIRRPLGHATEQLADLRSAVTTGHDLSVLLPPMLGGDGPRQYLVLAQSNAELRTNGGVPGAMLLVTADDGAVALDRTASSSDVGPFPAPVAELRPDDLAMYGEAPARFVQDVTMIPQFPVSGPVAAEMWRQSQGEEVDGVVAVDPVTLSYLLEAVGPVDVIGWTLDPGNVVEILLNRIYLEYPDPDDADDVFAAVASAVVDHVLRSPEGAGLLEVMMRAGDERRLLVWSAHADEQELLADGLGGDFDAATGSGGVFLNDGTRSKMSYYLDTEVTIVASECTDAGRADTVELRLTSTVPADLVPSLPSYVTGVDLPEDLLGTIRTNVALHSPVGGAVVDIERDGVVIGGQRYDAHGREVTVFTQDLAPSESVTIRFDLVAAEPSDAGTATLWATPTTHASGLVQHDVPDCSADD
ncbi:DUF4012 domain-containing protein [Actinotalea caeni]|uniref:DUF4012 domain-containing protein n=1 Tax=Actinotalea caeni TaxID=1348467 RepID=UPI0012E135DD|nr:DUF4012 domain-containing protein [Actinotalea caeni]